MENVLEKLQELSGKKFVKLTERGNAALDIAFDLAKKYGRNIVLIPDQAGWIHYKLGPKKKKMQIIEVKTDEGLIDLNDLSQKANDKTILVSCSMPGYFAVEDVNAVYNVCKQKDCWWINDASGSIGTEAAKIGDVIICSFGEDKPINLGYGGFIATNNEILFREFGNAFFDESKKDMLLKELERLPEKLKKFSEIRKTVISELKDFDIIHRDKAGIDIVIRFKTSEEKEKIIKYCNDNHLEFTLCPRYMRVKEYAVSIEVKRINI